MGLIKHLLQNTGLSMVAALVGRASNVILFIMISRGLGAREAGMYTLAFSYTLIATRLCFWGLDHLLIRESAKDSAVLNTFFSNFAFLRVALAILAWLGVVAVSYVIVPPSGSATRAIIILFALRVIPDNVSNLCQAVFISRQRMGFLVLEGLLLTTLRLVGGGLVLWAGLGLEALTLVIVASSVMGMVLDLYLVLTRFVTFQWALDRVFLLRQLKVAWPLVISGGLFILDDRLDILMLSLFLSEAHIGIYNAAVTVVSALSVIPQAYQVAVFPTMSRLTTTSRDALEKLYAYSIKYMLVFAFPLALALAFFADPLMAIFGQEFGPATYVLSVLVWVLPLLFVNAPATRLLVAIDRQWVIAATLLVRLVTGALLSVLLIPRYTLLGSALARLISFAVIFMLNYAYVIRWHPMHHGGLIARFFVAALVMVGILWPLRDVFPWGLLLSGAGYVLALVALRFFSEDEKNVLHYAFEALSKRAG